MFYPTLITLFLLVGITNPLSAQHVARIDFTEIKKETEDSSSTHFYPDLTKRFVSRDSTLTFEDYKHLYYGRVFRPKYRPYGTTNEKKSFLDLVKAAKYEEAIKEGEQLFKSDPVDLEVLLQMSICYLKTNQKEKKIWFATQYFSFLDVIYSSGDGKESRSAYVVTSVDHEYMILNDLGLNPVKQVLIDDCDLLFFKKSQQVKVKGKKKIKQLYFNVRMPLMSLSKSYKDADLPDEEE